MSKIVSAADLGRGLATSEVMFVALGEAVLLALAVWLKLARPEYLKPPQESRNAEGGYGPRELFLWTIRE